jgi:cell division protein FtsB
MNDLRAKTEQVKKMKVQLVEAEKTNKGTHASMMRLEQTIKDLKSNAVE